MNFAFSEEQEMFRHVVREFAKKELASGAQQRANSEALPPELIKKMGDNGLLGINVPEEYGGQLADWISVGIMQEKLGRVDQNMAQPMISTVGTYIALSAGSEELRQEWLPSLCAGEKMACIAMTEPDCGADAAAIKTKAVRDGDDYIITGEKTAITRGMHADMAKWFSTEAATQAIHNAITIYGHAGYSNELPLISRMLNSLGAEIYEGPAQIQKMIIARDLIGREYA